MPATQQRLEIPTANRVRSAFVARRAEVRSAFMSDEHEWGDGFVLVPAGSEIVVDGTDQHYAFRAHDDHYYLSGSRRPRGVLVFDPRDDGADDGWSLFVPVPSKNDIVWHGGAESLDAVGETCGLSAVFPLDELEAWLAQRTERPSALLGNADLLDRPAAYAIHPGIVQSFAIDADANLALEKRLHAQRRTKDEVELAFMRVAAAASCDGHERGMRMAAPGLTERALQVEIETGFMRAGAERCAYASIVASGPNAAVLHAAPTARVMQDGELVLVDAAAEVAGYDSDVTRTYPVGKRFTAEQRDLYSILLDVQKRAVAGARSGVEYRELHLEAYTGIARGLVDFGLLRGSPDALVERDTPALFFPHGIGHLIGLGTHDVGGYLEGRERSERPGLKFLRTDLPLEPGVVVTIEPGIYFIDALLNDEKLRADHHDAVDWRRAESLLPVGGFRIEDDVLVTDGDPEVLSSALAKEIDDVEALRV